MEEKSILENNDRQGHRKRLRERFIKGGLAGFHDYEVLELLISYCIPRKDTKPLAKKLLKRFKSVGAVLEAPENILRATEGIGESTAYFLRLVHEIGVKSLREDVIGREYIKSGNDIIRFCQKSIGGLRYEVFQVLFLSVAGELLAEEEIDRGTLTQAAVYPRKIIERAFYHNAAILVLVHNHPGKTLTPSLMDMEVTKKVKKAAEGVEISIWDHVIITSEGYLSFKESGLLI